MPASITGCSMRSRRVRRVRTARIMVEPMLDRWLQTAAEAAGAADVDAALCSQDAVTVLLDLARDAAHGVARPGAPLATFAVGLAVGRSGGDLAELRAAVERVVAAIDDWPKPGGDQDAPGSGT